MARRARNRYAHLNAPQRELDFHEHGPLTPQRVKQMTEAFVDSCREEGLERIRIITGKGVHSKGGRPIVKPQVQRTLDALSRSGAVASWSMAKLTEGGEGAIDVRLG